MSFRSVTVVVLGLLALWGCTSDGGCNIASSERAARGLGPLPETPDWMKAMQQQQLEQMLRTGSGNAPAAGPNP
jgi:hypothetical protein